MVKVKFCHKYRCCELIKHKNAIINIRLFTFSIVFGLMLLLELTLFTLSSNIITVNHF